MLRLALFIFVILLAACEKKSAQYILKTPTGLETSSHYNSEALEPVRKYIRVEPHVFRRDKRILEKRNFMQKRRNKHYFPRR